jgi:hypothetical protein
VERVEIGKDREIKIIFRLNILEIVRQAEKISEVPRVETYTRIPGLTNFEVQISIYCTTFGLAKDS